MYVIYCNTPVVVHKLPTVKKSHKRPFGLMHADAQGKLKSFQSIAWHFCCIQNVKT